MSAVDLKYTVDDIEIIDSLKKVNKIEQRDNVIIDLFSHTKSNGDILYVDETTIDENLKQVHNDISEMLQEIERNNPLNRKKETNNKDKIIKLNLEPVSDYEPTVICDYSDPTEVIYVDFDSKSKKNKTNRKFSLKRVACTIGLIFGLGAAISNAPRYNANVSNDISYQQDIDDTKVSDKNSENIRVNKKKNKSLKVSKVNKKEDNSVFQLKDATLHYTSNGDGPSVNTSQLNCDGYVINKVAIYSSNGDKMDVVNIKNKVSAEKLRDNCESIYGDDVEIKVNVDGIINKKIVYKKAGWISLKKVINKKVAKVKTYAKKI